jgi:enamine deaminase RidA (YjgF/YER057c/UK114 family)
MVFLSGMIPADKHGNLTQGSIAYKTHQMCKNAEAVLNAAGSGSDKVVKIMVGSESWPEIIKGKQHLIQKRYISGT